jgi:nucleotide-binding universal stress UspA family protein
MFKNILVPVDGSPLSEAAVRRACSFAKEAGARLTFYYAKPGYWPGWYAGDITMGDAYVDPAFLAAMDKHAETILRDAAQVAGEAGVGCETLTTEFDAPHEGIIATAEARGCDLIFMASHGRRGPSALLLGSETQKVLTHCKIPVLVYR